MGTKTLVSESEYLRLTFDGSEPDYVDGEIKERGMPTNSHSQVMLAFCLIFGRFMLKLPLYPRPEIRFRAAPGRYRIADIAVYAHHAPSAEIPPEVPYVVIEVVSPDDRLDDIMEKLDDYQAFGIPHIWLADPALRRLSVYRDASLISVPALTLPEVHLDIKLADIFG